MTNKDPEHMTEAELAEYQWEHRDDDLGEQVEFEVASPLAVTMSFRLPASEAARIRQAAEAAGMSLSEWIRRACEDAATVDAAAAPRPTRELDTVQDLVQALQESVARAREQSGLGSRATG